MTRHSKSTQPRAAAPLPIIRLKVAGIDLGSCEHWVCGPARPDGQPNVRTFRSTTPQLEELAAWLIDQKVESVAMESTHVYWIPLFELLASKRICRGEDSLAGMRPASSRLVGRRKKGPGSLVVTTPPRSRTPSSKETSCSST